MVRKTYTAEHRLWKVLKKVCFLAFSSDDVSVADMMQRNRLRKKELYELCHNSPFRLGLAVFYSMPSPASCRQWAGVAGLRRLFGREALLRIGEYEKNRVDGLIRKFVSPKGTVIAFQKDAYIGIKSLTSPCYSVVKAKEGKLVGNCQCDPHVRLFCRHPTRLLGSSLAVRSNFKRVILEED